jgi:hypothetical protein
VTNLLLSKREVEVVTVTVEEAETTTRVVVRAVVMGMEENEVGLALI